MWMAGPDYLSEKRFNYLKRMEGNTLDDWKVTGSHSTIETYPDDWKTYWRTHTGHRSAAYYAKLLGGKEAILDLYNDCRNGIMTRHDLEMYRRLGGRGVYGLPLPATWEEYETFATTVKYRDEVGLPSFTKEKFDQLIEFEKQKRVHTYDKLFRKYSNWADYCSRWGGGTAAKGAVSDAAGGEGAVLDAVGDDDVMDINGAEYYEPADWIDASEGGAEYYEPADWIDTPEGGAASGIPWDSAPWGGGAQVDDGSSLFADDPEGGLGIPARLADMMSMLHGRLLSLEVGLRSRNLYRAGM
jgi:hypothetical protein